jgi:hypothetical protein
MIVPFKVQECLFEFKNLPMFLLVYFSVLAKPCIVEYVSR